MLGRRNLQNHGVGALLVSRILLGSAHFNYLSFSFVLS